MLLHRYSQDAIKCTNQLGTGNLDALISNISYDISGDYNYNEIFAQMTASNMPQVGFPGQKDFVRMGPHERQI